MRKLKNLKIYKSILVLGTNSIVLMTSCGEVREVEHTNEYKVKEEIALNEKIGLNHVEPENIENNEYVITITDENGNDVTNESNVIEKNKIQII